MPDNLCKLPVLEVLKVIKGLLYTLAAFPVTDVVGEIPTTPACAFPPNKWAASIRKVQLKIVLGIEYFGCLSTKRWSHPGERAKLLIHASHAAQLRGGVRHFNEFQSQLQLHPNIP